MASGNGSSPPPVASAYLLEHGRLPRLGDPVPPWRYQGWLLPYVQAAHRVCGDVLGDRWGYYARIWLDGKLPPEPIPPVQFAAEASAALKPGFAVIKKALAILDFLGPWAAFRAFVEWLAFGLQLTDEYPRDLEDREAVAERLYRELDFEPWFWTPYDYLGAFVAEGTGRGAWNPNAFYPTPMAVVAAMVRMTMADLAERAGDRDPRLLSVCDPCVGSGRMLLCAGAFSLRLFGADIDPLMVVIARVNGALYVPWMAFGLPPGLLEPAPEPPPPPVSPPEPVSAPAPAPAAPEPAPEPARAPAPAPLPTGVHVVTPEVQERLRAQAAQLELFPPGRRR